MPVQVAALAALLVRRILILQSWSTIIEESFAPALGGFAIAWVLLDVGFHPGVEDAFAVGFAVKASVEIECRAFEIEAGFRSDVLEALIPSGSNTMSDLLTGAIVNGDRTYPWLSEMAITFSPVWCLWPL